MASRVATSSGARPRRCCATCTASSSPEIPPSAHGPSLSSARMNFFAVLFALLIEQLKPLPRSNVVHDTLTGWMRWTGRNFDAGREHHAWVVWGVTVLLPAVLVCAIYAAIARASLVAGLLW